MARIDIKSTGVNLDAGLLQLANGVAMSATLTAVTDQNNTASPLLLSTNLVQTTSTLKITTADNPYIDAEDNSGNNRFTVGRDPGSQQVNVDFASNPAGSTTTVGAIRTYGDGVNLSEAMTFREDGNVGINTVTPGARLDVHSAANVIAQFNRTGAGKSWIQYLLAGAAKWNTGNDNTNGNFTIYDAVAALDRLVVTNAGKVGIGTSAPTSLLQMTGNIPRLTIGGIGTSDLECSINFLQNSPNWPSIIGTHTSGGGVNVGLQFKMNGSLTCVMNSNSSTFFGGVFTIPTSTVHIKGSGSTSATTSLLVQNSAGTAALTVEDGLNSFASYLGVAGGAISSLSTLHLGGSQVFQVGNPVATNQFMVIDSVSGSQRGIKFGNQGTIRMALIQDGSNLQIGTFTSSPFLPQVTFNYANANTGFGTISPNTSAVIDITSTTRGFLPPRMSTAQKNAIASPAAGLMVYDTNLNKLCVYTTAWETITSI